MGDKLVVHYWDLSDDLFISFNEVFHNKLCALAYDKTNNYFKNCFYNLLGCSKWHAQRLFNRDIRFRLNEFEKLRIKLGISRNYAEKYIETIGNHENRTIIKNPKLPFKMRDLIYVASHLFFDGCFRLNNGNYFYVYDNELLEYHKNRLKQLGDVPINFIKKEYQLYFSYTLGYIVKHTFNIPTFNSTTCFLSKKVKILAKRYKVLADEIIKALIIDEGAIEDKVKIELSNERLVKDLCEVISKYYKLRKITYRKRSIRFKDNPKWKYISNSWGLIFASENIKRLYISISPLPIDYKEDALKLLYRRKIRKWYKKKPAETKSLIIKSLLEKPKSVSELANSLCIKNGTVLSHLYGHPTYSTPLIKLGIIKKINKRKLKRGGYTNVNIYGIDNKNKAIGYIKN